MSFSVFAIIEACVLGASCSIDAFIVSFAYGSRGIKIPMICVQIINVVCKVILGLSFLVGNIIKQYIPSWLAVAVCFGVLFIIGVSKLLEKEEDSCELKIISPMEAAALAVALSLDGLGVGFGAALGDVNGLLVILWTFITDMVAVMLGCYVGNKIAHKLPFNMSRLSGVILIALAFAKLF